MRILEKIKQFLLGFYFLQEKRYIFFSLAFVCIIFVLNYFFNLKPAIANKKLVFTQIVALEAQLKAKKEALIVHDSLLEELKLLKRQFFLDNDSVKKNIKRKIMLSIISAYRLPQSLIVKETKFITEREVFPPEFFVEVSVNNNNEKYIRDFFCQIANLPYPIFLQEFSWSFLDSVKNSHKKNKLRLLFSILGEQRFLYYAKDYLNLPPNVVVKESVFQHANLPLLQCPLDQLEMVGVLTETPVGKKWGLIKLPNEDIYKVELADKMGVEKAAIIFIGAEKIIAQVKGNKKEIKLRLKK